MLDRAATGDKADEDYEKLNELKKIIIQKIDTLKDLIGIKDEECRNIQDFINFRKTVGSEEFDPTELIKAAKFGAFNSPNQGTTTTVYNPVIQGLGDDAGGYDTEDFDDTGEEGRGHALFGKRDLSPGSKQNTSQPKIQRNAGDGVVQFPDIGQNTGTGSPTSPTREAYSGTKVAPPVDNDKRKQQKAKGKSNFPSGGKRHENKQTRRVKKRLRKTLNKISKMTYKNKTKRPGIASIST